MRVMLKIRIARTKYLLGVVVKKFRYWIGVLSLVCLGVVIGVSYTFSYIEGTRALHALLEEQAITILPARAMEKPEVEMTPTEDAKGQGGAILEVEGASMAWKAGEFSAYTASVAETDASPSIMASGRTVYVGAIACPPMYQFGDKIEVEGFGVYTCEDRMNIRYRNTNNFDIFFASYSEAIQFGRKVLKFRAI